MAASSRHAKILLSKACGLAHSQRVGSIVAQLFFGSGVVRRPSGEIVFVPSSATVDYLYYQVRANQIICSNSLPFLLSALDDRLDGIYWNTDVSMISIGSGIERYEQEIPTKRGSVRRLMYHNMVTVEGKVRQKPKPLPPKFDPFECYRSYFDGNYRRHDAQRSRSRPDHPPPDTIHAI